MTEELQMSKGQQKEFAAYAERETTRELVHGILTYAALLRRGSLPAYRNLFEAALQVYRGVLAHRRQQEQAQNEPR